MTRPYLVIGLVGPVGVDLKGLTRLLTRELQQVKYKVHPIRLSDLISECEFPDVISLVPNTQREYQRIKGAMEAGSKLRGKLGRGDALAFYCIDKIHQHRRDHQERLDDPEQGHAFVLHSLKHPDEVTLLRQVYGPCFFLISAYATKEQRIKELQKRIANSESASHLGGFRPLAEELIGIDEDEQGEKLGQHVRETYWRADAFVDVESIPTDENEPSETWDQVKRVIKLWFGHPFKTPSRDEIMMFHAHTASLRSASMGRQVGAAIAAHGTTFHDVSQANTKFPVAESLIATGANEVPKAGGGQYWPSDKETEVDDGTDHRDHVKKQDPSEKLREKLLADTINRLVQGDLLVLRDDLNKPELLARELLVGSMKSLFKNSDISNLTEFMRPVHAEMAAITDAARRGIALQGSTLYATTFPCHGCARHIVSSGIMRVVYIEPYAKSLAGELHSDSIAIDTSDFEPDKVRFQPFIGLAPRRFVEFFTMPKRKDEEGRAVEWKPSEAYPRVGGWKNSFEDTNEKDALERWRTILEEYQSNALSTTVPMVEHESNARRGTEAHPSEN